jgi:hypothetical protein
MREAADGSGIYPFTSGDDIADPAFGEIFYGIYGWDSHGIAEHIADRSSFEDAAETIEHLIPGLHFSKHDSKAPPAHTPKAAGFEA